MYSTHFKRFFDFTVSIIGFILISPLFLIVLVVLSIANQGSPFFVQPRPGKDEKIFNIVKFKTMNDKKDPSGELLPDDQRITRTGKFVRKTSLDEIPQLINVIKGDMSLVGPRPLLVDYLPLYNEEQRRRHHIRPGITGWAQIKGRNAISWEEKFAYDVWYLDNISFWLDLKILFGTFVKVFKREGISQEGKVTMEKWNGESGRV